MNVTFVKNKYRIFPNFFSAFILLYCGNLFAAGTAQTTGDWVQYALPLTAFGLTAGYHDRQGAIQFGQSWLTTIGITEVLKYGLDDLVRPNKGSRSFPSGHTSTSFASAEFMRKRYGWAYGIPAYLAATFVAHSRVESRQHYPRDVVAGAAIGILSSNFFTKPYKRSRYSLTGDSKSLIVMLTHEF